MRFKCANRSDPSSVVQRLVRRMLGAADDLALLFDQPSDAAEAELAKARANMRAD